MAETKNKEKITGTEDVTEFIKLLKGLTETDKARVEGIMIGMKMREEMRSA